MTWQVDFDCGALPKLRIYSDMPTGLLDESIHLTQAESRSLAHTFGCVERIEGALNHLRGHAGSGIRHANEHILARYGPRGAGGVRVIEVRIGGFDGQFSAIGHRVAGVDAKIHDRALELRRVSQGSP